MGDIEVERSVDVDVVVVGAGFAGLYAVHRLYGDGWSVQGFEAGDGVGGTWYWNRYPGARCDVESLEYSFSFDADLAAEWEWTERFAAQPEILRYLEHVADRFDLRRHFRFGTTVTTAAYRDGDSCWHVSTADARITTARFLVMATGALSTANMPAIRGLDDFAGRVVHTGRWPHGGVDLGGKRVGVIGTGSSGIQAIPVIAEQAAQLTVFQRTAGFTVPARNRPLTAAEQDSVKADYDAYRDANRRRPMAAAAYIPLPTASALELDDGARTKELERRWDAGGWDVLFAFTDQIIDRDANAVVADYVRDRIRDAVADPATAAALMPVDVIGCKRLCLDTGYYETYNRPNVRLVDLRTAPIERITATGLVAGDEHHELEVLVFATGFDAMTGALARIAITGRDGKSLTDEWRAGPRTYLGLGIPGFPNMFVVAGPGSPSVLTNMVMQIEQHVDWIAECLQHLRDHDRRAIEANGEAADRWVEHVNAIASATLFPSCNSWYLGANVPGKPRVFMPLIGFPPYVVACQREAKAGYPGFSVR